jgi:hypothetical protein
MRILARVIAASAFLLIAAAMAIPGSAIAASAPAFVQQESARVTSGVAIQVTLPKATAAGNLLVVYVAWDNSGPVAVTDSRGNTYTSAVGPTKFSGDRTNAQIFYARSSSNGTDKVTAALSSAISVAGTLYVHEYSGVDQSAPVIGATAGTGSSRAMSAGLLATGAANALLFAGGESNRSVVLAGNGFTTRSRTSKQITADRVAPAAGMFGASALQTGNAWVMQLVAFRAAPTTGDTTPPSPPTDVRASSVTSTAATISWTASTDNKGVTGYTVSRNGIPIAQTAETQIVDPALAPGTTYTYTVAALDGGGNVSPPSAPASVTTAGAGRSVVYPLKVGPTGRYLVDQNSTPFLINGDSPQSLIVNLSETDAAAFLADRAAAGFNAVWINLLCNTATGGRPDGSTPDGIVPFTTPGDLSTPNPAYFARADDMIHLAAQNGLTVFLDPAETAGWLNVLLANGTTKARAYGQFLGARYRNFDNIVWMSGNDFQTWENPTNDAVVQAVALGIRDLDSRHIQTVELNFLTSGSLDDPTWAPIIQLDAAYTYFPTYAQVLTEYNRPNALPTFLVEANYEFENNTGMDTGTPPILRRQAYWTLLSGATGQFYGNGYTWQFKSGWQSHLDTPGSAQMGYAQQLFASRRWFDLVPDQSHAVVTAGYGTFANSGSIGANDYVTAARTPDGTLVMAYMPTIRAITVNMSTLASAASAWWYDPTNGTLIPIAGSPFANSGSRQFQPGGNNSEGSGDWVLVLQTNSSAGGPPRSN